MSTPKRFRAVAAFPLRLASVAALVVALPGCDQRGSLTDDLSTIDERADLSAVAGPPVTAQLRPVERVPRDGYGIVSGPPLVEGDLNVFVYPSADSEERQSLLEGLTFFTTAHTASEGLGPVNNQSRCLGCHLSSNDAVGVVNTVSHVSRAARSTPTNFDVTAFNPATGGGVAADDFDAINGAGKADAFTIFGNFSPSNGTFEGLGPFSGFVQHTRPSIQACLPDPILPVDVDPFLRGGIDPSTGLSPHGIRRAVGERAGPPYIGRGLMEAIYSPDIIANEDPQDRQDSVSSLRGPAAPRFPECVGDCISGRHNENTTVQSFVGGDPVVRLGRFGLRAAGPAMIQFIVGGINGELGFTTEFTPQEPNNQINSTRPGCEDRVADPEIGVAAVLSCRQLLRMTAPPEFGESLLQVLRAGDPSAPMPAGTHAAQVQRGAQLFGIDLVAFSNRMIAGRMPGSGDGRDKHAINRADVGVNCAACHTPVHTTGASPSRIGGRLLSNVWAPIFSDLLLHEGPEVTPERIASTPRKPFLIARNDFNTFDLSRNLTDDAIPNQGVANGKEFRTPPLMGMGRMGPPYLHDARVYLSNKTIDSTPLGTVYSDSTVTNAPLVVRTLDDAIRAAIEVHDLPAPDDARTPSNGGCPLPPGNRIGEVRYAGPGDVCPAYESQASQRNRSEAREVIRRFRSLSPADQQALIEFLKQL